MAYERDKEGDQMVSKRTLYLTFAAAFSVALVATFLLLQQPKEEHRCYVIFPVFYVLKNETTGEIYTNDFKEIFDADCKQTSERCKYIPNCQYLPNSQDCVCQGGRLLFLSPEEIKKTVGGDT